MHKIEHRAVMKFLTLEKISPKEIFDRMAVVYQDSAPSYSTVKEWTSRFKCGQDTLDDDPRQSRPKTATDDKMVDRVRDLVLEDRRISVSTIEHALCISHGSVITILHDKLHMSKVSARWVPRMLTPFQKQIRLNCATQLLTRFQNDKDDFLDKIVTLDQTWIHHYDPESKRQSMQWKTRDEPPPKKSKKVRSSAGKIILITFWDSKGVILTDYLQHGQTYNGQYHSILLGNLREKIKQKRRGNLSKGILLLQDNAPAHTSQIGVNAASECGFEILPHPPYSPDLAPSDFFLFPNLKK